MKKDYSKKLSKKHKWYNLSFLLTTIGLWISIIFNAN